MTSQHTPSTALARRRTRLREIKSKAADTRNAQSKQKTGVEIECGVTPALVNQPKKLTNKQKKKMRNDTITAHKAQASSSSPSSSSPSSPSSSSSSSSAASSHHVVVFIVT
jgi:hypothetical protein